MRKRSPFTVIGVQSDEDGNLTHSWYVPSGTSSWNKPELSLVVDATVLPPSDASTANIILSETGLVKLIDFGLAKAKTATADTGEGVIKGKFNYVAPEYIGGMLDARADLWALGVVMYELLTSRRLFDAPDEFETMNRVRKLPIPQPSRANPRVTPELDAIVMTALERDPGRRWQSAAMMRDALRGVIAQPGNFVDNRHVIDWVNWVFSQEGTEASGVSKLLKMTKPMAAVAEPAPEEPSRRRGIVWLRRILTPRSPRRP